MAVAAFLIALGALDCSSIVPPRGTVYRYEGRKLQYSWYVEAVCNANCIFTSVLADFLCSCCDL